VGPLALPLEATVPAILGLVLIIPKNYHPIVVNFRQVRHRRLKVALPVALRLAMPALERIILLACLNQVDSSTSQPELEGGFI
jgi:hypothetical protein